MATKALTVSKKDSKVQLFHPQRAKFLALYLNPDSESYGNAFRSAVGAGFAEEYAKTITAQMPQWLAENIKSDKSTRMLSKAERNLEELLDFETTVPAIGAFGPIFEKSIGADGKEVKTQVFKTNTEMLKIKSDVSKFVAERLGRLKYGVKDQPAPPASQIVNYNLFYKPEFQETLRDAETRMKHLIENAKPTQEA